MAFYLGAFSLSLVLAAGFTALVRRHATSRGVVDVPAQPRKLHGSPTPLLGGIGIYLAFSLVLFLYYLVSRSVIVKDISPTAIIGLTVGGLLLMIGGYLDDRYHLKPGRQLVWPILAALAALVAGISVKVITNPLTGGLWDLGAGLGMVVTFLWLMGMMYTTKLLDGLDGLATGIGVIGSLIIFSLTQFTPFYQPSVGLLAAMLAGAAAGFLIWNWYPARIFLGEGGSLYLGFTLGVLAIISGAKIATALLVMGVPILDVAWVIVRRVFWDKTKLSEADRKHLHYRLLDAGMTHRQSVVVLYAVTLSFGLTSLFLRTNGKLIALGVLVVVMAALGAWVVWRYRQKQKDLG